MLAFSASALATGGSVSGWGYNYYGQANGTAVTSGCECAGLPGTVPGISEATQVSGAYYHSVALRANGSVVAWGYNGSGQLGDGTLTNSPTPVAVKGISNAIAVAAGGYSSMALLANGTVVTWGDNEYGELGLGTTSGPEACDCSATPVPVPGLSNVVAIDAGYYYNVALLADGQVMTWGYDYYGELGDGAGVETGCECVDHPVPVPGISGAVGISADWYVASALLQDGTIRNWGYNYDDELGTGTPTQTSATSCYCLGPVSPVGLSGARETASGGYHGLALLSNGTVSGWGYNEEGQTGNGEFSESHTPAAVKDLSGVKAVSAGAYHSLALLSNGTVMGWGGNEYEQVGDGTTEDRNVPVTVSSLGGVSAIEANDYSSFAIVGPSQTLNVSLTGGGTGKVGGAGILCPADCSKSYPQGQVEVLRPEAGAGSGFAGFSGPCSGTGPCQVNMSQDQTVTATFGPPVGTAITKSKVNSRKKRATFSFTAPGAITGFECKLVRPKPKPKPKHGKGHKHPAKASKASRRAPAKFSACVSAKTYKHLSPGGYTFKVRALDILGADAKPASRKFRIKPPKKHHKPKNKGQHKKHHS
jgi:alpha-tubulin suppressor-like RCC1 family protein